MSSCRLAVALGVTTSVFAAGGSATASLETTSPLVGTWRTNVISQADAVEKRKLALRWLTTTEPPDMNIPDKVFQHALYMTRNFSRVG